MANENQTQAQAAADAPAKVVEAVADTVKTTVQASEKAARTERAAGKRRAKRVASATARPAKRQAKRAKRTATRTSARKAATNRTASRKSATVQQRIESMVNGFNGFDAVPAFAPFQNMFFGANERSQEIVKRGQKVAEELSGLARANVEAVVEAGRVAAEGARTIGQDAVAKSRDSFEQAADAIRSLAEAKSPTEYLQLQGEIARASFDRAVAESSKLAESMVKLAGEAFQPLSNRASANAERFNTLVA